MFLRHKFPPSPTHPKYTPYKRNTVNMVVIFATTLYYYFTYLCTRSNRDGWTSTELILGFILVTNSIRN
jgi:hypothetical protein